MEVRDALAVGKGRAGKRKRSRTMMKKLPEDGRKVIIIRKKRKIIEDSNNDVNDVNDHMRIQVFVSIRMNVYRIKCL